MNKLLYSACAVLLLSSALPSCALLKHKPSKKKKKEHVAQVQALDAAANALKNAVVQVDSGLVMKTLIEQTAPVWQHRLMLNTFSAKAKMHYESGDKSIDFVANIRMRKDSIIWVSVSVAGLVQVARAIITPDSFKAVLYTEKEAYQGPISKASSILPEGIDFYSLQNLLLGNPILNQYNTTNVVDATPNWIVRFEQANYIEQVQFDQTDSTLRSDQLITQGLTHKSLTQILSDIQLFGTLRLATQRKLTLLSDSTSMLVDMNYSNVSIDNEMSYPFSIPQNYTLK